MQVCNSTTDRKHADVQLENYVTDTVMSIITTFFSSPFSDQSTNLQVISTQQLELFRPPPTHLIRCRDSAR